MLIHSDSTELPKQSRFGNLMGLYAHNYWALTRILGPDHLPLGRHQSEGSVGMPLLLDVVERAPYTVEMKLSYAMIDPQSGQLDPSAHIRLYRDARLAEVVTCYFGSRLEHALGRDAPGPRVMRYRLQRNAFFAKWLDYLEHTGHNRFAWRPVPADTTPPT